MGDQTASTMNLDSTKAHYPDTDPTDSYLILVMPRAWLKHTFLTHWFDSTGTQTPDFLLHARSALYHSAAAPSFTYCIIIVCIIYRIHELYMTLHVMYIISLKLTAIGNHSIK